MPSDTARPHTPTSARFLRERDGHEARVTNVELFFDLIYAFAVTQLSHRLVHNLSAFGALETLVLWFAVWLGWQYTCWVTNWFNPERIQVRLLLFVVMLVGMVMAASLPLAYGERGLVFAISYVAIQVGRSLVVLAFLGRHHALTANFRRICWTDCRALPAGARQCCASTFRRCSASRCRSSAVRAPPTGAPPKAAISPSAVRRS
jgi:low temperature requirement protein LtrA